MNMHIVDGHLAKGWKAEEAACGRLPGPSAHVAGSL